ncbi:hypothetical protein EC991_001560 [Linnemannia zychae]|nr:hypothetical protein EC991_001560 [Linnemannia zychae]
MDKSQRHPLMLPEILWALGENMPLFEHRYIARSNKFLQVWDPKPLLRASMVCKEWREVMMAILWQTYDLALMERPVPYRVLSSNIQLVRNVSLLNDKHKKHIELWDALAEHKHINRLEVHEAIFPVKKLIGSETHTLAHLKLSGNCTRMHSFLIIFIERQKFLRSLELARFKFTASDWKRIVMNKPHLRNLVIGYECDFLDFNTFDKEDKDSLLKGSGISTGSKNDDDSIETRGVKEGGRMNRIELVNTPLPDAKDFGALPVTQLILRGKRLLLPFHEAILKASPHLEQLEICYSVGSDGKKVGALIRDNCKQVRRLTLQSNEKPWTLAIIESMPLSVEELILYTGQLDFHMAAAIKNRAHTLKRLDLDFGLGVEGKRRLAYTRTILDKCTKLREFTYHSHVEDTVFEEIMLKEQWNLPHLRKLAIHGVTNRVRKRGISQGPSPNGWRQKFGCSKGHCCNTRSYYEVHETHEDDKATLSPLFDITLLDHLKNLPMLTDVVITEANYHKTLD